jgi:hypothetical protein
MNVEVGKIYEVTHPLVVETVVFDANFEEVARLELGETFVVLEFLGINHYEVYRPDEIVKMKILTTSGKIGFCSFWASEIKIVQN